MAQGIVHVSGDRMLTYPEPPSPPTHSEFWSAPGSDNADLRKALAPSRGFTAPDSFFGAGIRPSRVVSPQPAQSSRGKRHNGWRRFIDLIDSWAKHPDCIPVDEDCDCPSLDVLSRAAKFAREMYRDGKLPPTLVTITTDGAVSFQVHAGDYGKRGGAWETYSFTIYDDGTADTSFTKSNGESGFRTISY